MPIRKEYQGLFLPPFKGARFLSFVAVALLTSINSLYADYLIVPKSGYGRRHGTFGPFSTYPEAATFFRANCEGSGGNTYYTIIKTGPSPQEIENQYYNRGKEAENEGRYADAEQAYRGMINANPSDYHGYLDVGVALEDESNFDQAENYYDQAHKHGMPEVDYSNAIDELNQKRSKVVLHEDYNRGNEALTEGNNYNAEQAFRRMIDEDPSNPAGYNDLANALSAEGEFAEAEMNYEKARQNGEKPNILQNNLLALDQRRTLAIRRLITAKAPDIFGSTKINASLAPEPGSYPPVGPDTDAFHQLISVFHEGKDAKDASGEAEHLFASFGFDTSGGYDIPGGFIGSANDFSYGPNPSWSIPPQITQKYSNNPDMQKVINAKQHIDIAEWILGKLTVRPSTPVPKVIPVPRMPQVLVPVYTTAVVGGNVDSAAAAANAGARGSIQINPVQ